MYATHMATIDRLLPTISCYQDKSRIRYEVDSVLRQIPSLQPTSGTLMNNDGTSNNLLYLTGTIPMFYNGAQYNVPMDIWIPQTFPYAPPISYVRPTADMMIKPGHPNVNPNGFVRIPYTDTWNPSTHCLVEAIGNQSSSFGSIPPVFKRPAAQPYQQQSQVQPQRNLYNTPQQQQSPRIQQNRYSSPQQQYTPSPVYAQRRDPEDTRKQKVAQVTTALQQELRKVYKKISENIDTQFSTQMSMSEGQEAIKKGKLGLKAYAEEIALSNSKVAEKNVELTKWLDENKEKNNTDPDEILVPADTWSKQMFEAVAEQQAIEDALFTLDSALRNGHIELDIFLKTVRNLSRKQFMQAALIQRISEKQTIARRGYH